MTLQMLLHLLPARCITPVLLRLILYINFDVPLLQLSLSGPATGQKVQDVS
jgi:hypothetical protein